MIQIYSPSNTNFSMNGDSVIFPESCEARAKLNGEWYMDIQHPLDEEGRWKHIVEEAVISAPTFMGEHQLFRIDDAEKGDDGVKAKAYPVFFDSADDHFIYSCKPTFASGQNALNMMMSGSKYSGESNITKTNSAEFINRNLMDCINGDDPAFIRYWGGDVLYDNYKVIINSRAGSNRGFEIRYRRNMDGIRRKVDMSNVVTRIVPVAYNGRMITNKYVDSPNIGKYAKVYIRLMEFTKVKLAEDAAEEEAEDITVCSTQAELNTVLTKLCNEQFATGIDLPNVTLDVDMVALSDTEEYKQFTNLETVSLGDTAGVYHRDLDIYTEERVIEITWDCIRNKATELTLGDYEYDYLIDGNKVVLDKAREEMQRAIEAWKTRYEELKQKYTKVENDVSNLDGNVTDLESSLTDIENDVTKIEEDNDQLEQFVAEELDAIREELAEAKDDIQGSLDSTSGMFTTKQKQSDGSYIYYFHDQSELASSTNIWKMTSESIAVSVDGGKTYPCGITVSGDAILNLIYAKGINADYITAGKISDESGESYWDLGKGDSCFKGRIICKDKITLIKENPNNGNIDTADIEMSEVLFEYITRSFEKNSSGKYIVSEEVITNGQPCLVIDSGYGLSVGDLDANGVYAATVEYGSANGKSLMGENITACNLAIYNNLKVDGQEMTDFIVEQGTSGVWTYEKWKSGKAVCWGVVENLSVDVTETWGSIFVANNAIVAQSYPFTFKEVPTVQATPVITKGGNYILFTGSTVGTTTKTPSFGAMRGSSASIGVKVYFTATGKWK